MGVKVVIFGLTKTVNIRKTSMHHVNVSKLVSNERLYSFPSYEPDISNPPPPPHKEKKGRNYFLNFGGP